MRAHVFFIPRAALLVFYQSIYKLYLSTVVSKAEKLMGPCQKKVNIKLLLLSLYSNLLCILKYYKYYIFKKLVLRYLHQIIIIFFVCTVHFFPQLVVRSALLGKFKLNPFCLTACALACDTHVT